VETALAGISDCRAPDLRGHQRAYRKWQNRVSEGLPLIWKQFTWMVSRHPVEVNRDVIASGRVPVYRRLGNWQQPVLPAL